MTDHDDVRDALQRVMPEMSVPDGFLAGARRRRAQKHRAIAGGAVAAVALVVAPFALNLGGGTHSMDAVPASAPDTAAAPAAEERATYEETPADEADEGRAADAPAVDPAGGGLIPAACTELREAVGYEVPTQTIPDDGLPLGASAVWLCGESGPPYGGALGAHEPLTTDVDGFVQVLNDLPRAPADMVCTAEYVLSYLFVVEYPDGSRVPLEGGLHGCRTVGGREGADEVWNEITNRWAEQREAQDTAYTGDPDLCVNSYREPDGIQNGLRSVFEVTSLGGPDSVTGGIETTTIGGEAVRGVICGLPADATSYDDEVLQRPLPDDLVAGLAEQLAGEPVDGPGWSGALLPYIVLLNRYGDPATLYLQPDGQVVSGWHQYELTEELRARVLAETEGLRTERFAQIPEVCSASYSDPQAEFADVVSGVVCISEYDVPELGPELPDELAVEIATRFDAEAGPHNGSFRGHAVVLSDGEGGNIRLELAGDGAALADADANRRWPIPDDILAELVKRGFDPEQQ